MFISHHLDEVMELTDRVTIMRDGHVVKVVNTNEITKDEMINLMAGKKVEKKRIKRKVSDEIFFEVRNLISCKERRNFVCGRPGWSRKNRDI